MSNDSRFPKLIAFDLDYTLWDLWIDTHVSGPLRRHKDTVNQVLDRDDQPISFYRDIPTILHRIRAVQSAQIQGEGSRTLIAACSRTQTPDLAYCCLNLLLVPPATEGEGTSNETDADSNQLKSTPAIKFFDELEIYPGSKLSHFKKIHQKTGVEYSEMLFFDDEYRNKEVQRLGVVFHHVPAGVNNKTFEQGLAEWRKRTSSAA